MLNKFLISALCISSCFGMNPKDSSFVKITEQNIGQFENQIIAFQTNSRYFFPSDNYTVDGNNSIYFGQVSSIQYAYSNSESGYNLHRLIKKEANGSWCALTNSKLSKGFSVRLATKEEIEKIENAIKNNEAQWD